MQEFAALAVAVLAFLFSACGGSSPEGTGGTTYANLTGYGAGL